MGRCGRQAPPRTGHVTRTLPLASHWPFRVAFRPAAWGGRHVGAAAAAAPAPQGLAGMEPRAAGTGGGWRPAASEGESQLPLAARALEEEAPSEPEPEPQPQEEPPRAAAVNLAMSDHFYQKKEGDEDEVMKWRPKLACGAQNVPILGEVDHPDEDEVQDYGDSEEDLNWELEDRVENSLPPEPRAEPPVKEDWDTELILDQGNPYGAEDIHRASIQDFCLWAPRAQQGDLIYDPSWHHPAPLTPHYSKMVFETGQFDDAED
ncbi:coordinator of PRMT5 and differentiation stimulator isoform X2 [Monodelphis domestica]|uniref:Coordinator of PRMT5 and differentiation stimulator n=1 Tax=Monodelphis domestica TaxID=13616 RepID=F6TJH7_MONDO|nr:coordinator of PRMT5 and differentiation stimulator isoform X2 [Monodelphis domestica]